MLTYILSSLLLIYLIKGTEVWAQVTKTVWSRPENDNELGNFFGAISVYPLIVLVWPIQYLKEPS